MCTVLLPPGVYPIAVKYIVSYHIYHIISYHINFTLFALFTVPKHVETLQYLIYCSVLTEW